MRRSQAFLALVAALVISAPGCAPPSEDAGSAESANTLTQLARRIRMARFKESLAPVMRSVISEPTEVGQAVRTAIEDADRVVFNTSIPRDAPVNQIRKSIAALGKGKLTRRMMVKNSLQAIERRSTRLKQLIERSTEFPGALPSKANWFDEVVVGTGPQGVAYLQASTDLAATKRILAVDAAERPGGTFANVGEAFALNSTNRANTGTRARPGEGDLNFIQDIWGLPDFQGQKWVPAGGLGDLSAVGTDLSSADVLMGTKVTKILDRLQEASPPDEFLWPARYQIEITDVATGKVNKVFAEKIVVASGIGTPTIPIRDPATVELIARERARVDLLPDEVPGVQTFSDLVNRIGGSETPYRWAVGKDVVVAGGGDSGKVINEFLFRLGPEGAYGQDVAQVGNVRRVFWFGVSFEDCQAYIAQSRARYARLAAALNSGELVPVPGKIESIVKAEKGFALTYRTPDGQLVTNEIRYTTPRGLDGTPGQAVVRGEPIDNVVLATGFKSDADQVLADVLKGRKLDEALEEVVARPDGFDNDVAIATRVTTPADRTPQEIFFIGPANEVRGGLPRKEELAGVNANTVSLFANVSRTRELALRNARSRAVGLGPIFEILETPKIAELARNRVPGARVPPPFVRPQVDASLSTIADIELKVQVAKVLNKFEVPEGLTFTVNVVKQGEGRISIAVPELDAMSERRLAQELAEGNPALGDLLFGYFGRGSGVRRLEIVVPTVGPNSSTVREGGIEVVRRMN